MRSHVVEYLGDPLLTIGLVGQEFTEILVPAFLRVAREAAWYPVPNGVIALVVTVLRNGMILIERLAAIGAQTTKVDDGRT